MPHQNVTRPNAAQQNTVNEERGAEETVDSARPAPEARSYVAGSVEEASLAPPAAGEVDDVSGFGDALDGEPVQQGRTRTNAPHLSSARMHGPKTRAALRARQTREP